MPTQAPLPERVSFAFEGYPVQGRWQPQLEIIPVDPYLAIYPDAAESINVLRSLIAERPALGTRYPAFRPSQGGNVVPHLPPVNEGLVLAPKMKYVDSGSGAGIRYIAFFAQDAVPVDPASLKYTFQGLTNDGKYYISASFPVTVDIGVAPPAGTAPEEMDAYYQAVATSLEQRDDRAFTPALDMLDALIASIQIGPE